MNIWLFLALIDLYHKTKVEKKGKPMHSSIKAKAKQEKKRFSKANRADKILLVICSVF